MGSKGLYILAGLLGGMAKAKARKQALQDQMNNWQMEKDYQRNQPMTAAQLDEQKRANEYLQLAKDKAAKEIPYRPMTREEKMADLESELETRAKFQNQTQAAYERKLTTRANPYAQKAVATALAPYEKTKTPIEQDKLFYAIDQELAKENLDSETYMEARRQAAQLTAGYRKIGPASYNAADAAGFGIEETPINTNKAQGKAGWLGPAGFGGF